MERLHEYECKACPLNRASLRSPKMAPAGPKSAELYIVGSGPTRDDDEASKHFAGAAGRFVWSLLRDEARHSRRNNIIRCHLDGGEPRVTEMECCRPSIVRDIELVKPKAIALIGTPALRWAGAPGGHIAWRGRRWPIRVGEHAAWAYAFLDPDLVLARQARQKRGMDEYERVFREDVKRMLRELPTLPPAKPMTEEELRAGTQLLTGNDPGDFLQVRHTLVRLMETATELGADVETHPLRCYGSGAKLLSIALSTSTETIAIALEHPEAGWRGDQLKEIYELLRRLLVSGIEIIWHNAPFDLEWMASRLGLEMVFQGNWHDTKAMSYVLDGRQGTHRLQFCSIEMLGIPLKELSSVDKNALHLAPLLRVLEYNALDARATVLVAERYWERIVDVGLESVYLDQVDRIRVIVAAQFTGVPVSSRAVRALDTQLKPKLADVRARMDARPSVARFRQRFGTYNPLSPVDNERLFRDILGEKAGVRAGNKYSTDDDTLKKMRCPEAKLLASFREIHKLHSSYVEKADPEHPESYVQPDGRIHTSYDPNKTVTRRLASSDPAMQNFPKRKHREVRRIVRVRRDEWLLAVDEGQMEARMIAEVSGDRRFKKALHERYDIHLEWAERAAKAIPDWFRMHDKNIKRARTDIKNSFVFPSFFGAGATRIAAAMKVPGAVDKVKRLQRRFHRDYSDAAEWRESTVKFYERHGYVETLTGFRRYGPMSFSEIVNAPVQGTASDVVIAAWIKLADIAYAEDRPYLIAPLQIHDDLTFVIPKSKLDSAVRTIVEAMTKFDFPWLTVPLCVEAEIGRNWCDMRELGVFYSDEV